MQYVTSETVKYLFLKFHARYGSKWVAQYPPGLLPVVQDEWLSELKTMVADDIKRGIDNWQESWPPNIVDFKKSCKKQAMFAAHCEYKCLEQQKTDPEKARNNLKKMREAITGSSILINNNISCGKH